MRVEVSYLIPSYNHEPYLLEALTSIQQDIQALDVPAEVIIIDDGSTDNSIAIVQAWMQTISFPVVFIKQANYGLATTLNKLIANAAGDYLRLCSSDDRILPGSTQLLLDEIKRDVALICVVGDGHVVDAHNSLLAESSFAFHKANKSHLQNPQQLARELIQHWCVAGPCHLIKKSHYQSLRYNKNSTIDDFDLFLSLLTIPQSLKVIDAFVCQYRIHETNTSKTKNTQRRLDNIQSFSGIIDKYKDAHPERRYLLPLKYKTLAKLDFLQKKYLKCAMNMSMSLFLQGKLWFFNP